MLFRHNRRLVVQESDGSARYVLPVISANTDHSYPFTIPTANIDVISGNGIYDYMSGINFDDIFSLEVSNTFSEVEKDVWQPLAEGRIMDIQSNFGQGNTAKIIGVGHANALAYTLVGSCNLASADAGTIAQTWNADMTRVQVTCPVSPTFNMAYSAQMDQKYVKDVCRDIEDSSGYSYFFDAKPTYDSSLNLVQPVDIEFRSFPATPVTSYGVYEGSPRLIYANFTVTGKYLFNYVTWYGATPSGGTQYNGNATDDPSSAKYDLRMISGTDTAFTSSDICGMFANGVMIHSKDVQITGTAVLVGTPEARICDLVPVQIGDIDVNGFSLSTNLYSVRVSHDLPNDNFLTTLQFGRTQKQPTDFIGEFIRKLRLNNNLIR